VHGHIAHPQETIDRLQASREDHHHLATARRNRSESFAPGFDAEKTCLSESQYASGELIAGFGSALNQHVHLHVCLTDRVYKQRVAGVGGALHATCLQKEADAHGLAIPRWC
jgi:hypothetical protein